MWQWRTHWIPGRRPGPYELVENPEPGAWGKEDREHNRRVRDRLREEWGPGWIDEYRNCINTRNEVLKYESIENAIFDAEG